MLLFEGIFDVAFGFLICLWGWNVWFERKVVGYFIMSLGGLIGTGGIWVLMIWSNSLWEP